MTETLVKPLVLYRFHGYGKLSDAYPIISKYKTVEDYTKAVAYNLKVKPRHALFTDDKVINQGVYSDQETRTILEWIKQGRFETPEHFSDIVNLHSS